MRVFLDTKFADWDDPNTDLISLALSPRMTASYMPNAPISNGTGTPAS